VELRGRGRGARKGERIFGSNGEAYRQVMTVRLEDRVLKRCPIVFSWQEHTIEN
jgi:hypothetical protein